MTRQNTIPSDDNPQAVNALIPLWDFCNHTQGQLTTTYNRTTKCCECFAIKSFDPGEQIFIFYGARSNPELFIHNGFVYEGNEHDGYWLRLGISKSDALKEERIKVLNRLSLPEHGEFCLKPGPNPVDGQLLAFLRIFNMDGELLLEWQENDNVDSLQDLQLVFDPEFEHKYWRFIVARLKLILGSYKTSLVQDLDLIKENSLTGNSLLACKMRASEKKILENGLKCLEQHVASLPQI